MNLQHVIEQFIAYRKSLGERQAANGRVLLAFGRAMGAAADIADVRTEQVVVFLTGTGPLTRYWHNKLSIVRVFYRYAISRGYVATAPLPTVIPKEPPQFVPYIYSHDDLRRLLQTLDSSQCGQARLEPITARTIILLLYGTGMRVGEATRLNRVDVDLEHSLLTIRHTKFHKSRLVPFGPKLGQVLTQYAARAPLATEAPFFTMRTGTRVVPDTLEGHFRSFCTRAGVRRNDDSRYHPRLHDLRHTFAVHRLTAWYREGADVQQLLPQLSVYMGHGSLRGTQVYLSMTAELLREANVRFARYAGKEEESD
jgi:integrase